jgi:hypothetical protein
MAVETIKCRECGSAEVTEFKPGSYVCGHCEAVVKHMTPAVGAAPGCEIRACGVMAVGRCYSCGRAFCSSHKAHDRYDYDTRRSYFYTDWCRACQAEYDAPDQVAARKRAQDWKTEQRRAEHLHAVTRWETQVVQALATISHPAERAVRAVAELGFGPYDLTGTRRHGWPGAETQQLKCLLPSYSEFLIRDRDLADWFLGAVVGPATHKIEVETRGLLGGKKWQKNLGWLFDGGSAAPTPPSSRGGAAIAVLKDGALWYSHGGPDNLPDHHFNERALTEMFRLTKLAPSGLPPHPSGPGPRSPVDGWPP